MELPGDDLALWKAGAVLAWLVLFFTWERMSPAARPPGPLPGEAGGGLQRLLRNAGLWLGNTLLSRFIILPVTLLAASYSLGWRPEEWQGGWSLVVDILILDLLIYWWHRANHEFPFLWRFHQVHHLDRRLDSTSAVRFHFGEVLLSAAFRCIVVVLLDIPFAAIILHETVVLIAAIFQHSNVRLPKGLERALGWVIITPGIHWIHHHAVRHDTDSNYGTLLSLWDRLFGSLSPTQRHPEMPIGVEYDKERSLGELLLLPFGPQKPDMNKIESRPAQRA